MCEISQKWKDNYVSHPQTFCPKIYPVYKKCRDKVGTVTEGMDNKQLAQLEIHPVGKQQPLTLLMMLCCAYRQQSSYSGST